MTAIVYKDWFIVSPQESIRPYSMQCSGRVCGSDRDFFALSSETTVSAPLLNNLSLEKLESGGGFGTRSDVEKSFKLHLLHKSGMVYVVAAVDYLFDQKLEVMSFDATKLAAGEIADYQGVEGNSKFLKGVAHNTADPHEMVRYMSVLWPDVMSSYYAIPLRVFLEWMKSGADGWPFEQFPKGSYTECLPEELKKPITRKSPARKTQAKS
jgi:hypothetical protein